MCGICCVIGVPAGAESIRSTVLDRAKRIRHRGPDWTGVYAKGKNIIVHERLSIVDVETGNQPLKSADGKQVLVCNGEIYNHLQLRQSLKAPVQFATNSDSECILHLYNERGVGFVNSLNGIFGFVLIDEAKDTFIVARDHEGIIPLYYGWDETGALWVASELKALHDVCVRFEEFPPGHVLHGKVGSAGKLEKWYQPVWHDEAYVPAATAACDIKGLRESLEAAVERQMMTDVPYGVLLSGGLDSSVISAVAVRVAAKRAAAKADSKHTELGHVDPKSVVHSFSVGLKGSPDLKAAREVAAFIGTEHHEFVFTVDDGINALRDVIYHLETFDTTTIRASTAMYLMSRKIKALGVKMVLSGEGSDEVFGGYLYFHKAPDRVEFHKETVRKLKALNKFDCLRANKSTMAWGLEARVPFLDKEFLDFAMTLDPTHKMCGKHAGGRIEKWIVRKAFEGYLPPAILWRQKEQFSDGVGYSWIDSLKAFADAKVSDAQLAAAAFKFPENTPLTKESYLYRSIFETHYPEPAARACVPGGPSVACSTPAAIAWDAAFQKMADPSGRAVAGVHADAYAVAADDKTPDTSADAKHGTAAEHKASGATRAPFIAAANGIKCSAEAALPHALPKPVALASGKAEAE
uniref:Asparagine synthetase [glutamine-hydrolyzing] n=1 Tax=Lotus japonicus TaxID=34305 RepID=Q84L98_LOTJA|nr:asparagine synthetase 3 [Lotus japonicus]